MTKKNNGPEELFGYSVAELARIAYVDRSTASRWKSGRARVPGAALALVRQHFEGELGPRAGPDWRGARFGHDGLLYLPDMRRGFSAADLRQLHWLLQSQEWRTAKRLVNERELEAARVAARGSTSPAR